MPYRLEVRNDRPAILLDSVVVSGQMAAQLATDEELETIVNDLRQFVVTEMQRVDINSGDDELYSAGDFINGCGILFQELSTGLKNR